MARKVKHLLIILVSLLIAINLDLMVHESGYAIFVNKFGARLTRIQFYWLNFVREEKTNQ